MWRLGAGVVLLIAVGWIWVIATGSTRPVSAAEASGPARVAATLANPVVNKAYVTDAAMRALAGELRGASGKLRVEIQPAGAHLNSDTLRAITESDSSGSQVAPRAGIWKLAALVNNVIRPITNFNLISTRPLSEKVNGRVGLYYIGNWPGETGPAARGPSRAPADRYRPPSGFIEVTQQNADTYVSEHFRLRDFLTHDQANVWPKYLVLQMRNVDKLEPCFRPGGARHQHLRRVRDERIPDAAVQQGRGGPLGASRTEQAHVWRRRRHLHRQRQERQHGRPEP